MTKKELLKNLQILRAGIDQNDCESSKKDLDRIIEDLEKSFKTPARAEAAKNATDARTKAVKEKIQNAINLLRIEGKEITAYQLAKTADINYLTARKYLAQIDKGVLQ